MATGRMQLLTGFFVLSLTCMSPVTIDQDVAAQGTQRHPEYRPSVKVSGVIRIWGTAHMEPLLKLWQAEFRKYQPDVWFVNSLHGTASAQFALHVNAADLAVSGRRIFPYEFYGIYRRSQMHTTEIEVATGSYNQIGKSTAYAILVHKDNPLQSLSMEQLDGIFGDQRSGGWNAIEWDTMVARGPEKNIRTWGELGLMGEWADQSIQTYGPPGLFPGGVSFFQTRVMGGADTRNENLKEYDDRLQMLRDMEEDRYSIGYASAAYTSPGTKVLSISEKTGAPPVALTRKTVMDRTYPLWRPVYFYYPPDTPTGDPATPKTDPKVAEFIRFVLSAQGQGLISQDSGYLPLPVNVTVEQLNTL